MNWGEIPLGSNGWIYDLYARNLYLEHAVYLWMGLEILL